MPNFLSKNDGIWFYFDSNNESLGGVCLRVLSPEKEEEVQRLTTKKTMKPIRGIMTEIVDTNDKLKNELMYDYWICDWKTVQLDNKNMPCNKENKLIMMKVTEFAKFVLDNLINLNERNLAIEEARVKNLNSISNGNIVD